MDGQKIATYADLSGYINTKRPNDKIQVTYTRNGKTTSSL
jgi:S1-C subfamily serine protease